MQQVSPSTRVNCHVPTFYNLCISSFIIMETLIFLLYYHFIAIDYFGERLNSINTSCVNVYHDEFSVVVIRSFYRVIKAIYTCIV